MQSTDVLLASQSPRRGELLEQLGVSYERLLPVDAQAAEELERELPGEQPLDYVRRVVLLKLRAAQQTVRAWQPERLAQYGRLPVLCADTTVSLDGRILGKPADAAAAAHSLRQLSGSTHQVITAVAMAAATTDATTDTEAAYQLQSVTTLVRFRSLSDADVCWYVDSGEWQGKAGGYGIQGRAAAFVQRIEGSYTGVVGLPLSVVCDMLRDYNHKHGTGVCVRQRSDRI